MPTQDPAPKDSRGLGTQGSALRAAEQIQRRAARLGFDWEQVEGVLAKIEEELAECRIALANRSEPQALRHEIGDLLFSCINLARYLGVDPEEALRLACRRFDQRFAEVERRLRLQGLQPGPERRALMEQYWEEAKAAEDP